MFSYLDVIAQGILGDSTTGTATNGGGSKEVSKGTSKGSHLHRIRITQKGKIKTEYQIYSIPTP